ncbi:hypothetical protein Q8G38_16230 [Halomonas venusta]|nr:hypothetical protein [Halomonas venusta]MDW0360862.1 hypothetical protein [Halomonas venusta]
MTARFILREYHEDRICPRVDAGLFVAAKMLSEQPSVAAFRWS